VRVEQTAVLLEDPELAGHLQGTRLAAAERECVARVIRVRPGAWSADARVPRLDASIGLLVLEGLLARRVGLDGRFGAELLGAGDLLRPWQREDAETSLPHTGGWRILRASRIAVLDDAFAVRAAQFSEVTAALVGRAVRRSRHLAINMAIVHQPRIDVRLHMLFWELAYRWGAVGPEGVSLRVRLTHEMLGELVAARRPSVTKALSELSERGSVSWTGQSWLLRGQPPGELGEIRALPSIPERSLSREHEAIASAAG
jgi:CRP/FNR family transcriptional regulator, cyclic AMP receptor protein